MFLNHITLTARHLTCMSNYKKRGNTPPPAGWQWFTLDVSKLDTQDRIKA